MKSSTKAIGGALLAAMLSGPADSAIQRIDFGEQIFYEKEYEVGPGNSVLTGGYVFTVFGRAELDFIATGVLTGKVGDGSVVGTGTPRLFALNDAQVRLTHSAAHSFDLLGLDFGGSWTDSDKRDRWAASIEITGYRHGIQVARTELPLDPTNPEPRLATWLFDGQFRNLDQVFFHGFGASGQGMNNHEFVIDNLVVSHAPEPETYAMLMAGLGLLAWRCRRSRT